MRLVIGAFACLLLSAAALHAGASPGFSPLPLRGAPRAPNAPGAVVVALAPGTSLAPSPAGAAGARDARVTATLARFGLAHAENLRRASKAARKVDLVRLRSDLADFDPVAAAAALRALPGVLAAAPDLYFRLHVAPNDPYLSTEWPLSNSAAAIHAQQAWAVEKGDPNVVIAIIDTGVDIWHPDLYPKLWINPGEIDGNGIDDDGNGYQDDICGWDFGDNTNDPEPEPMIDPSSGIDVGWHGTFVAGLAAAATNNGVGIAGVAWNCRFMPLKVSDYNGNMALSSIVSAIDYAASNGASIINLSMGSTDPLAGQVLQPLIDEATDAGVLVVASAGNLGTDTAEYPAACDSVLAVASTNASNLRSSFSNWGWYVDVCAPGENVWSTIAEDYNYDSYSLSAFATYFGFDGMHAYMSGSGTSFAAPIVAGAAALVRSHFPGLAPHDVMQALKQFGDVKTYDDPIGPKVNPYRVIAGSAAVEPAAPALPAALALAAPAPNPARAATTLAFALPRAGHARLAVYDAAGREVRVLVDAERAAGGASVTWDLRDVAGRPAGAGLYFARLEAGGASAVRRLVVIR